MASISILIPALVIGIPVAIIIFIYLIMPMFRAIGFFFGQIGRFVGATVGDLIRLTGASITGMVLAFLAMGNVILGRWSAAQHYGRAIQAELTAGGACIYRLAIGNWARLFCLKGLVEGLEQRVPQAIQAAPGPTMAPRAVAGRAGQFDGYEIVGTLAGGGSGGRLYVARPTAIKQAVFQRQGFGAMGTVGDVVIKSFSVREGSSLPQIVRESRALEAAKKLGLVLEHELTAERFFYVMRYVPGDALGVVASRLHAASGAGGLDANGLSRVVGFATDLVSTLDQYHRAGLWHKDIKPDNIIVSTLDGRAHLVDFGLITPLRSSLTLTTHGTEYFRDPEMVRLALKGVKVHEVDGARFDIYGAGAVIFSIIENSFPAHGGLSQITRRCPDALRWIVRRAMTDYDKRYPTSALMLADLRAVAAAPDPFAVKPADLPSMSGAAVEHLEPVVAGAGAPMPAWQHPPKPGPAFAAGPIPGAPAFTPIPVSTPRPRPVGVSAAEQVRRARERAARMQERIHKRLSSRGTGAAPRMPMGMNGGVVAAIALFVVFGAIVTGGLVFTVGSAETPPGGAAAAPLPPIEVLLASDSAEAPTAGSPESPRAERAARRGALHAKVNNIPVMVMREPEAFKSEFDAIARQQVQRLRDVGFRIVADEGDSSAPVERDAASLKAATDATAQLRKSVGVPLIESPDKRAAVMKWITESTMPEGMVRPQIVVWLTRHATDPKRLTAWVIPAKGLDAPTQSAAQLALSAQR